MSATVGLIWDGLEEIGRPRDPQGRTFSTLDVEVHLLARHWITAVSSDPNDDVLETIGLSKFFGTGKGTKVRLEAVNMEELNDTGIECRQVTSFLRTVGSPNDGMTTSTKD